MSINRNALTTVFAGASLAMMLSTHLMAAVTPVPAPEFIPMVSPSISLLVPPGGDPTKDNAPILAERSFTFQAGETRRVFGRVEIASSTNSAVYVETFTQCVGPDGTESQHGGAAQNHEGKNTPAAGTSYPVQGHLVLYPLLLFTAPAHGVYSCQLRAAADGALTALATDFGGTNTTWLQVSAPSAAAMRVIGAPDAPIIYNDASWWQNPPCDGTGDTVPTQQNLGSACLYLAGASNLKQLYVFDNDGTPPKAWDAPIDAAFLDASDSLMLTPASTEPIAAHLRTGSPLF
jgi:hypothetical protein